jgi:hypothetical protein
LSAYAVPDGNDAARRIARFSMRNAEVPSPPRPRM